MRKQRLALSNFFYESFIPNDNEIKRKWSYLSSNYYSYFFVIQNILILETNLNLTLNNNIVYVNIFLTQ